MTPTLRAPAPAEDEEPGIVAQTLVAYGQRVPVCSFHFKPVKEERRFRTTMKEGYRHVYHMSGVKSIDDHPIVLIVTDAYEKKYERRDTEGRKMYTDFPILAKHIAADIVHAGSGAASNSGPNDVALPAFWISQVPENRIPRGKQWELWREPKEFANAFPEFWEEAIPYKRRQHRWCESRVAQADAWHAKRMVHEISSLDRECGNFIHANLSEHPWIEFSSFGKLVDCPFCGKGTSPLHPDCAHCGKTIDPVLEKQVQDRLAKQLAAATK